MSDLFEGISKKPKFLCPYCFEELEHTDVEFRASKCYKNIQEIEREFGYTEDDIEVEFSSNDPIVARFKKAKQYCSHEDEKYNNFWAKYGNDKSEKDVLSSNDEAGSVSPWEYPIIDKTKMIKLLTDEDGFLIGCTDTLGNETLNRVCCHCHNPLPTGYGTSYGKHPIKRIAIVGIRGAGKTVYISQLLDKFKYYMVKIGINAYPLSNNESVFVSKNRVEKGVKLPESTQSKYFSQPMYYDISYKDKFGNRVTNTVVFYDIAGENCISSQHLQKTNFHKFIMEADGMILLIDPSTQIYDEKIYNYNETAEQMAARNPAVVMDTLHSAIPNKTKKYLECEIPLAVCVSKSDVRPDIFNGVVQQDVQIATDKTDSSKRLFNGSEYNNLQRDLVNKLDNNEKTMELMGKLEEFRHINLFALTAIGCNVDKETGCPLDKPNPKRIEEPVYWLFKQFGIIESNTDVNLPRKKKGTKQEVKKKMFKKEIIEVAYDILTESELSAHDNKNN